MLTSLSQAHLKQLETCPRRFQHGYLDQLTVSIDPDLRQSQEWGTRFHLVMQQRELGISVEPLLATEPELSTAVHRLLATAPDLFQPQAEGFRQSEHRRTTVFGNFLLTVVYDLLVMSPLGAQIVDWKTYLKPTGQQVLKRDWQTRLYLYVLAETTAYAPEQISMEYWFVRAADPTTGQIQPTQVTIPYTAAKHRQTGRDLKRLTNQLSQLVAREQPFPQVDPAVGVCDRCPYAIRCQRPSERYPLDLVTALPAIEDIAEVPL